MEGRHRFSAQVVPGRSDRSYGIHVARLAGLPPAVVSRAREILNGLERDELSAWRTPVDERRRKRRSRSDGIVPGADRGRRAPPAAAQLDVNEITPMQALTLLAELRAEAGE
jgi:DNA mismatch repair protein MutS